MNFLGINVDVKCKPVLDEGFIPLGAFISAFLNTAKKPLAISIRRSADEVSVHETYVHGTPEYEVADRYYVERLVKLLLWVKGGVEVGIYGDEDMAGYINETYSENGARSFDYKFMSRVYEREFTVIAGEYADRPTAKEASIPVGGHLDGCRIGFDAGGSDRKVSAVVDGEVVYSEEVVWYPKENSDPKYHYDGILTALKTAQSKMPRVDAIGVSSAGIYVNNRAMVASLFIKIPDEVFEREVKDIYINCAKEIGDVPVVVANDGDVTALAGALDLNDTNVLGIAMGTSQAVGYINKDGNITGWLNELAFAPVDCQETAMCDEWSGDIGCGVKYFSQDGVIKLAARCGVDFEPNSSPAQRLKVVQGMIKENNSVARQIYESIGTYLAHSVYLYDMFYDIKHILLLGRVMSGEGGVILLNTANDVLREEYPDLHARIKLELPDETSRVVGQSVAAASLPKTS